MAEYVEKLGELRTLPEELHWFCDTYESKPGSNTQDDVRVKSEYQISGSVEHRRRQACECLMLFAYPAEEALQYQDELVTRIDVQLTRCDLCVINYYKSKRSFIETLRNDHDEDEVATLVDILNTQDFNRIKRGLEVVTRKLKATDSSGRHKDVLDLRSQLAIFEALSCEAFLINKDLVQEHFQQPFKLVQTNRRLKITHYVPAATIFLFDTDHDRWTWATHTWSKYNRLPTVEDFDFAIRDPLLRNLQCTYQDVSDMVHFQRLWFGVGLIANKLDDNLVTHSLRAMEIDIFRLALDHLKYETEGFRFLIQAVQKLLELAPKGFWDSMGAISPTTFIEQVFNNSQYDRFMEEARESEDYQSSALKDMLSWIKPFMASIETVHQGRACRSLAFQLLDRLQADRFPLYARLECKRAGLEILATTLINCDKSGAVFSASGRVVAAETLEVASDYIKDIINIPGLPVDDKNQVDCAKTCLKIIKVALALECKSLRTDQEALRQNKELPDGFTSYSPAIWDAVVQHLDRGNIIVVRPVLVGINGLTGLEKFKVNADESFQKEKSQYNVKFGRLTHLVCQILERINDFDATDLDELFGYSDTATALVASLFSPDANLYEAGVNLTKSISSQSARREAIGHLLNTFLQTTLTAVSWSVKRIARDRTYVSCPRMLKTCSDVLDVLCDSQDGLLRTRTISNVPELKAVESFWELQWEGLRVIYEMTEEWGRSKVADSSVLKEFCRDTMQLSERLFDQYSVFANALESACIVKQEGVSADVETKKAGGNLLQHPAKIMEAMVKWLRLRDLFLVEISLKLTNKVLHRLTEGSMVIAEAPRKFLEQVLANDASQARTHLKPQEKAELARALEANLGHSISFQDVDRDGFATPSDHSREQSRAVKKRTKSGTIDLDNWTSKAKTTNQVVERSDDEFSDSTSLGQDLLPVSRSAELMEKMQATIDARNKTASNRDRKPIAPPSRDQRPFKTSKPALPSGADQALFREKREKEREAKKKRDAEASAIVKKRAAIGIGGQTIGEGSALGSIGVKGKDHTPKGDSMMLPSGSEPESEDDTDRELFGSDPKPVKMTDALREYNDSKALRAANIKRPTKKTRQVRSAKDMRARLAPDLTPLHKSILSWDFFHNGDFPPNSQRADYTLVTNNFRTPLEYQNTFEPLLLLEAWQSFLKSREEGNFKAFEIQVANRMTVDAFLEVSTTMSIAEGKELGISEADIVLISKGQSPSAEATQPHCLARVFKISRKKATMEITYRANVGNDLVASMVPNSMLYAIRILSITPLEREYGALLGLKYFDLCDEVIRAKPSPLLDYTEKQLEMLVANYDINNAQAGAVKSAIDNDAFTLIQGPPGSGKTKTIVAIVGALLTGILVDKGIPIARPQVNNGNRQSSDVAAKKLLVCAPSNAAVDELVMRFKQGVRTTNGTTQNISVIRLGRSDAINPNVIDVTLEELVNKKLNLASKKSAPGDDVHKLMMAHKDASEQLNKLRNIADEVKASGKAISPEQDREFEVLKRQKQQLSNQIDATRDSGDMKARDAELSRRRIQQEIIDGAHIICATLSGSGHEMFQGLNVDFETVIIDEAAQSIELSALIPLKYGCSKCILVGDPKQLPPTVLSREAARFQYEQSLFVRMQSNYPNDVHLLDTQYRMHPEISAFPSNAFYDSRLLDGPRMSDLRIRPWHQSKILGPYRFFDVQGAHQSAPRGHSLINLAEVDVALRLFDRLTTDCKGYNFGGQVGIITPYRSQLRELRSRFQQRYGDSIFSTVEFNTTDAFQGRESEVIIFSCVRASVNQGIGFLSDIRRMNVGITRAKSSLWVLGNSKSLVQGEYWGRLIHDAKIRDRYTSGDLVALLQKPLLQLDLKAEAAKSSSPVEMSRSDIARDADVPDVPAFDEHTAPARRSPADAGGIGDNGTLEDAETRTYDPAGGANGLDVNSNCRKCGSFKHFTNLCDNPDAKLNSGMACFRCGSYDHAKASCTMPRCLTCGKFGHLEKTCTSTNQLPNKRKQTLSTAEVKHKMFLQQQPEIRRRSQLGGHDPRVPVVRPTSRTPSPVTTAKSIPTKPHQIGEKRKRDLSPPTGASKGRKTMNAVSGSRKQSVSRPLLKENRPQVKHSNVDPSLPRKNSTSLNDKLSSSLGAPPAQSNNTGVARQVAKDTQDRNGVRGSISTARPNHLPPKPPMSAQIQGDHNNNQGRPSNPSNLPPQSGVTTNKAGEKFIANPVPRLPPPLANIVRPPKRKKDVDPFIRPRKRP